MPDDRIQIGRFDRPGIDIAYPFARVPAWLARRFLRRDETIRWVRGPRFCPWWERYATHAGLFLVALLLGGLALAIGRLSAESWSAMSPVFGLFAVLIPLASVYVLAIANAYFTRLVVTDLRLLILQGYAVCRSWSIDDLPPALIRYGRQGGKDRIIDLGALSTMLGGSSEHFVEAKTIRALGRHLDQIKARENRP